MDTEKFKSLYNEILELDAESDKLLQERKEVNKKLADLKSQAVEWLEHLDTNNYKTDVGMIYKKGRVNVPIEDKSLFLESALTTQGLTPVDFMKWDSTKVVKYYEQKEAEAKENKDLNFLKDGIPGLGKPTTFWDIGIRGNKLKAKGE